MTRKTYYYFLLISLGLTSLYFFLRFSLFWFFDITLNNYNALPSFIAIFILIYETIHAKKNIKTFNAILFAFLFIGYAFIVMHWPFGRLIFLGSISAIALGLIINTFKIGEGKHLAFIILIIPVFRLCFMLITIYHFPGTGVLWFIENVIMAIVAIAIGMKLFRDQRVAEDKNPEILDD